MAIDPKAQAVLALHRFGFGPSQTSIESVANDPRGALLADLERPAAGALVATSLPTSGQAAREVFDFRAERAAKEKVALRTKKQAEAERAAQGMAAQGMTADENTVAAVTPSSPPVAANRNAPPEPPRRIFLNEAQARFDAAGAADIGFVERLVWFWSNHFCISADKIASMAGAYEREAIRPHVLGRFADMLMAVSSHPAMLFYLDNVGSIGPNSVGGINRDKGLNENLAREILELHTLGVNTGYSQNDVTSFAKVLTGWTWVPLAGNPDHGGEFVFNKRIHEPGEQRILGKIYADTGVDQGRAVLADLARHPATASHIGLKLARHFVSDQPPPPLVDRLAKAFRDTDGDLKEVAKALIEAPESWSPERTKLKRPSDWIVSALRVTGMTVPVGRIVQAQAQLGEPLWRPAAPNGFSDQEAAWADGLSRRLDITNELAGRATEAVDPPELLDRALGPLASVETRQAVGRAESRRQALTLLLMSPEFLRR
jgi:uncharacterized protein (DUF1800 family)